MADLEKHYSKMPPLFQGIIGVAVVGSIIAVGLVVYHKINKLSEKIKEGKDPKKAGKQTNSEYDQLKNVQKPNYLESQYTNWASAIFNALNGCDFHKNDNDVGNILSQMKSDIDFVKLQKAFGTRTVDNCGPFTGTYEADLVTFLGKEMMAYQKDIINKYFQKSGLVSRI